MQTIVPYLTVKSAADAIEFYKKAFDAKEVSRAPAQDGKRLLHADLSINDGSVFLMDEFPEHAANSGHGAVYAPTPEKPSATALVISYSKPAEVDSAFRRAVDAGCKQISEPEDTFWNARFAMVGDPYGHIWMLNAELPAKS